MQKIDLVWRNLAPKVKSAYSLLIEMLNKAPIATKEMLKVDFYQRTATGIKPITEFYFSKFNILYEFLSEQIKNPPYLSKK